MTVLVAGAAATWAMVGLIWLVQVVHYPMLARFADAVPVAAATDHQRRITYVVGPLMAVQGLSALWLLADRPETMSAAAAWVSAALLGVALGSTALVQVRLHRPPRPRRGSRSRAPADRHQLGAHRGPDRTGAGAGGGPRHLSVR